LEAGWIHFVEAEGVFVCRNSLTNATEPHPLKSVSKWSKQNEKNVFYKKIRPELAIFI
jgi:hypothetical protein